MIATPKTAPKKFSGFPGVGIMMTAWNGLIDYLAATRALPGAYLTANQTAEGVVFDLTPELKSLIDSWIENNNVTAGGGTPTNNGGGWTNPWTQGGGGTGTGLPDVDDTDPENPTYEGRPIAWRQLHICVDDGEGGYTPMVTDIFSTAPYIPA